MNEELDFIVKTAYGYIEDEDDRLEDFVGEDDFDHAMYYAMSKIKKATNFEKIIEYFCRTTHISKSEAFRKGKSRVFRKERGDNYLTCEGYIAFIKEGKYKKHIGVMKNE
jgi:hypothetical protein